MLSAFTIPILGRIENFWIIFALIIGSAIWEWIKRRSQSHDTGPDESQSPRRTTTTPPAATPRPAATSDWEAELRRLLG